MFKKIAIAATLALLASASQAATMQQGYAGFDAGRSSLDDYSGKYNSFGGFLGFRLNSNIAFEGAYRRLGSSGGLSVNQTAVSVLGALPAGGDFTQLSLYARLGYNQLKADGCDGNVCGVGSTSKALLGLGVAYEFTPKISGRVEYQKPTSDSSNLSVGVVFGF
ncbi:MAG: outer membrane beta-barrel protein [Pseudomonadota bacterium]